MEANRKDNYDEVYEGEVLDAEGEIIVREKTTTEKVLEVGKTVGKVALVIGAAVGLVLLGKKIGGNGGSQDDYDEYEDDDDDDDNDYDEDDDE